MDGKMNINIGEGIPLKPTKITNVFVNSSSTKSEGISIPISTGKQPHDIDLQINTTFAITSAKKIKVFFVINLLLSIICVVFICLVAFYYWNEIISMRRQIDYLKEQLIMEDISMKKVEASPLLNKLYSKEQEFKLTETRDETQRNSPDVREVVRPIDPSMEQPSINKSPVSLPGLSKEPIIAHFNGGAGQKIYAGNQKLLGPWVRDDAASSKYSDKKVQLVNNTYVSIQEEGTYLVYAQVVYETHSPSCFFILARLSGGAPRLLGTCATADYASDKPLDYSQISCSVQTVARLYKGDVINIALRENKRTILLKEGYSYWGFIKLSS